MLGHFLCNSVPRSPPLTQMLRGKMCCKRLHVHLIVNDESVPRYFALDWSYRNATCKDYKKSLQTFSINSASPGWALATTIGCSHLQVAVTLCGFWDTIQCSCLAVGQSTIENSHYGICSSLLYFMSFCRLLCSFLFSYDVASNSISFIISPNNN